METPTIKGVSHLKKVLDALYYRERSTGHHFKMSRTPYIYTRNLCTTKIADRVIVPMAWEFKYFMTIELDKLGTKDNPLEDKIVLPLRTNTVYSYNIIKRTADPIIGYLLGNYNSMNADETIKSVSTPNGENYFGGGGCVFDSNFTPLIIFGAEYIFTKFSRTRCMPVCVINPIVFQREDLISKYIVKKLIPYVSNFKINGGLNYAESYDMKVMITSEINKFMDTPAKPTENLDEDLWNCAKEYINEMLEKTKH